MSIEQVFTFNNMIKSANNSLKGVRWKASSQNFENNKLLICSNLIKNILENKYKPKPYYNFSIIERGKKRNISALHITDRVIQKCYCDEFLTPLLTSKLEYDIGACIKNKGVHFTRKRLITHLSKYLRKHNEGYVLRFDFKQYFDSIDHNVLLDKIHNLIIDDKLYNMYYIWLKMNKSNKGLGLGSQLSQISANFYTDSVDKLIKHKLKIKHYIRYMDDGVIIHESKEHLYYCLKEIEKELEKLKLRFNNKKTYITKLSKGFTFLKRQYIIKEKKIIAKPLKETFTRMRKKIKGIENAKDLDNSYASWKSSLKGTRHYKSLRNIKEKIYVRNKNRNKKR